MTRPERWVAWLAIAAATALAAPSLGETGSLTGAQLAALDLTRYPRPTEPPGFTLLTTERQVVSLAGLRGKVVILNFWATWCRECLAEMPALEMLHRRFAAQGLAVIGIDTREAAAAVQRYTKELGVTFPILLDPDGGVTARYGVIGLPTTFILGRDGRAVALAVGSRDWASATALEIAETLLGEPATEPDVRGGSR